jgi:threonine synthase
MNGYRCIACDINLGADFAGFQCPDCGGNLDVTYDYHACDTTFKGDDMFRYAPLLPVDRFAAPLKIGCTPLYNASRLGPENLFIKDETSNPSASIKDRATAVALQRAVDTGADKIAVASTGNAGSSTACIAAALGLQAFIFVPESAPVAKLTQALAYGATVLAVRGTYDDAYELCLQASQEFAWYNRSTGFNPFTREGKKTASFEIFEQLGRVPDRIVVPTGDGNILSGIWKGWRDLHALGLVDSLPKIDCAQSASSAAICRAVQACRRQGSGPDWSAFSIESVAATTVADSISVDQPRDGLAAVRAVVESGGEAVTVTDAEILAAIPELAQATGIFAEPAAAASLAATRRMLADGLASPTETIVCLVTGNGLKDVAGASSVVGQPQIIDPTLDAVKSLAGFD